MIVDLDDLELSKVFAEVFDLWGILDLKGRVVRVSGSIFDRAAIEPERLTGQIFSETVFWQSSEGVSRAVTEALRSAGAGHAERINVDFRVNAKERIPVELAIVPTGPEHLFAYARRIGTADEKNEATEGSSEKLLFAAENADVGLWYWNFGDEEIHSNVYCREILGIDRQQPFTYEAYVNAVHPDDREAIRRFLLDTVRNGNKFEYEFRIVGSAGNIEWIAAEGRSFLTTEGKPERVVGVLRCITSEKAAADDLELVYERERAARDEAELANRSKDVFLAFVSHELRAPLNAILGWSNILLTKEVDEATSRSAVETIERSARMQTKLINDLVDSARVASGKIRLEYRPTNLFGVVKNAVEAQRPAAEARGLDFRLISEPVSCLVMGDANRLQQVFGNLLSNAIKFTPSGGSVLIDVSRRNDSIIVGIADSGEGIGSDTLPNIFRQFSQVGAGEKHGVGLGLGLSITKTLVERHGGTVTAASEGQGKGARFEVTLPILDPAKIEAPPVVAEIKGTAIALTGLTVLIVEDDKDSRDILCLHLENSGAVVISAPSVALAFESLKQLAKPPDLIISDIGMPGEDGISFIKRLRSLNDPAISKIPAIVLTAFATSEFKESALAAGFQKYVAKPIDPDAIAGAVLEVVGRNGS